VSRKILPDGCDVCYYSRMDHCSGFYFLTALSVFETIDGELLSLPDGDTTVPLIFHVTAFLLVLSRFT
jgi:hypothetical protein